LSGDAYVLALARLTAREYSARELRSYLLRKGHAEDDVDAALARLSEEGRLDDQRYARMMTRHQFLRGKGPAYIQAKLRQKGVSADLGDIRRMIGDEAPEGELQSARRIVERRYPDALTDRDEAQRAYTALLRRGFTRDIARQAVRPGVTDPDAL
jgi:regulatory protein